MGTFTNAILNILGVDQSGGANRGGRFTFDNHYTTLSENFNNDALANDIVKTAIHRIANEVSKCEIKSVRAFIDEDGKKRTTVNNDSITRVFSSWVNPYCTLSDFLYKATWMLLTNENVFIYHHYREIPLDNGKVRRETLGFYIIECDEVKIYILNDEMRIELKRHGGVIYDMPYKDIIHIRHKYGKNKFLGGDATGNLNVQGILKNLKTMHVIQESVPRSLEASLNLKGVLTMRGVAAVDKKTFTRAEFEDHLISSKLGIAATDYEADFSPVNIPIQDIPQATLQFIRDEILSVFGVSLPIYVGKYTDDEFSSFYQTAIESILIAFKQRLQVALYTPNEIAHGNQIKIYDRLVQSMSYKQRKEIAFEAMPSALLDRDEQRELLGYEPDGKATMVSLNYIDESIANEYQLETFKQKKQQQEDQDDVQK